MEIGFNDIKRAYCNGNELKSIYLNGTKVWGGELIYLSPETDSYNDTGYLTVNFTNSNSGTTQTQTVASFTNVIASEELLDGPNELAIPNITISAKAETNCVVTSSGGVTDGAAGGTTLSITWTLECVLPSGEIETLEGGYIEANDTDDLVSASSGWSVAEHTKNISERVYTTSGLYSLRLVVNIEARTYGYPYIPSETYPSSTYGSVNVENNYRYTIDIE